MYKFNATVVVPRYRQSNVIPSIQTDPNDPRLAVQSPPDGLVRFDKIPISSEIYLWKGERVIKISLTQVCLVHTPSIVHRVGPTEYMRPEED